jgi:succinate dehydrogenase flavin-adding protein (antitoxin of CptAB toxin-antitoxin module)
MTPAGAHDPSGVDKRAAERLRWHARRGLLENDILLTRFLDRELAAMQDDEMQLLDELLRLDDNDLLDLLMGRTECKDARLKPLVERICQASAG